MAEEQTAPYDRIAGPYARHWAPVIRPAALRLLDHLAPLVPAGSPRFLDVGTGTGTLALAALERWPGSRATGIDASREMIGFASAEADRRLPRAWRHRFDGIVAVADRLPFEDGSFDVAVSSFVLQLVPSRAAALREARRVLRPGGRFGFVTWLRHDGPPDPPDRVFEEILDEFGFDPPEPDDARGEPPSPRAVAEALRRAGFRAARAWPDVLEHRWTARAYLAFLEEFAETSTFEELTTSERRQMRRRLLDRLGELSPSDLRLGMPVVYATAEVPVD